MASHQNQRKPRILCLHGHSSSGKILNTQIHRWPETVLEKLDLVFLDAPIPVEENPVLQEQGFDPPFYKWFESKKDMSEFTYFEECVAYLEDYMIKNGPFDGFLGFSQGAILSASLPGMQRDGLALTKVPKIKFLILISGGKFGGIKLGLPKLASTAFSVPLELPSLHIIGDLGRIKPQSIDLMEAFVDPFVIYHPEGHTIPKLEMEERQEIIDEGYQKTYKKLEEMLETLPKGGDQTLGHGLFLYKGFWLPDIHIKGNMLIHDHFKPRPTDIVLSSFPKCGTTWLKALCFAIINRNSYNFDKNHPLLTSNPHDLTGLGFERLIQEGGSTSLVETLPSPRLLPTHLAFSLFPDSMASGSGACRFVYICRNPKDAFVSLWHFFNKLRRLKQVPQLSLEDAFDSFSKGVSFLGPFWDHVLGYWKASLESPNKVLFLKYEDMMREPSVYVRKLAEFLDLPFSEDEENEGIVEKIVNLCSFENLSNLDVNKNNNIIKAGLVNTSSFFRKGQVGDWINHLSPEMVKVLDQITQESFQGTELNFD